MDSRTMTLEERIYGAWLGKSIGGTLGLASEGRMERQNLTYYDPVPTTAPPNDDLELQLVWLDLLEKKGVDLTQKDFGEAWLDHIHTPWDEYGRCRWNLRRRVPLSHVGTFENPFASCMGSPIRSEIWACITPGNPDLSARYAALDASLDHGIESIASEVYFASLQSMVLSGEHLPNALSGALKKIDLGTETAEAIQRAMSLFKSKVDPWFAWAEIVKHHATENFTHAPLNVALTVWAMLFGKGDFDETVLLAVNGGYDTDCTAATAGATLGMILGSEGIPARWKDPIGNGVLVSAGIKGISAPETLEELTRRTIRLAEKLRTGPIPSLSFPQPDGAIDLKKLPGTLSLRAGDSVALWANGELPDIVKAAGEVSFDWIVPKNAQGNFRLISLAEFGGTLELDDKAIIDCPAGLPYIPSPHRIPRGAFADLCPSEGAHRITVKLNRATPTQRVSVILANANMDYAAWDGSIS